jgi:hypothetical protein
MTLNYELTTLNIDLLTGNFESGWQDSNLRPSGPKPDAITGLRYTPKSSVKRTNRKENQVLKPYASPFRAANV